MYIQKVEKSKGINNAMGKIYIIMGKSASGRICIRNSYLEKK